MIGFVDVKDIPRASENIDWTDAITARELSRDVVVPDTLRVDERSPSSSGNGDRRPSRAGGRDE